MITFVVVVVVVAAGEVDFLALLFLRAVFSSGGGVGNAIGLDTYDALY